MNYSNRRANTEPSFLPRFHHMIDQLQVHPHIHIIDLHLPSPASRADIAEARQLAGGHLLPGMEAFYLETNGLMVQWEHTLPEIQQGDEHDLGSIEILPIQEVMQSWQEVIWFEADTEHRFRGVKPLDFFAPEACACLVQQVDGILRPTIYYHYLGEFLYDTGVNFIEYLERLLLSRGSWYWIESLCVQTCNSSQALDFLRRMSLLFADFQPALFQPRSLPGIVQR